MVKFFKSNSWLRFKMILFIFPIWSSLKSDISINVGLNIEFIFFVLNSIGIIWLLLTNWWKFSSYIISFLFKVFSYLFTFFMKNLLIFFDFSRKEYTRIPKKPPNIDPGTLIGPLHKWPPPPANRGRNLGCRSHQLVSPP